jgi:hypothetical protein
MTDDDRAIQAHDIEKFSDLADEKRHPVFDIADGAATETDEIRNDHAMCHGKVGYDFSPDVTARPKPSTMDEYNRRPFAGDTNKGAALHETKVDPKHGHRGAAPVGGMSMAMFRIS